MKTEMSATDALLTRRSVRNFLSGPVSEEELKAILRAGMFAPSAHNRRTWEFITVTKRAVLNELSVMSRYWGMLKEAPLCIVTCGYSLGILPKDEEFLVQNSAAATENMLLMAHSLGLGAVWLGICRERPYYESVKELLKIPADVRVVSLMAVGRPKGELPERAKPLERFEAQKWHRECY